MNQIIDPAWQEPLLTFLRAVLAFAICCGIVMLAVSFYCDMQDRLGHMLVDDGFELDTPASEQIRDIVGLYMPPPQLPARPMTNHQETK